MKPTIDYLNARRASLPASGGKTYDRSVKYAPDSDLDLWEQTDLAIDSAWSDYRINSQAMWERIFARFGLELDDNATEVPF